MIEVIKENLRKSKEDKRELLKGTAYNYKATKLLSTVRGHYANSQ